MRRKDCTVVVYGRGTYYVECDGREVARADVADDGHGEHLTNIRVEPSYRRHGIATMLYRAIEKDRGRPLIPSPTYQSPEAKALWAKRSRGKR